jgi:hypothetical protein
LGVLDDLPGRRRKGYVTPEAYAWLTDLACHKPKDVGYARELWTTRLLMTHVRAHSAAPDWKYGRDSLAVASRRGALVRSRSTTIASDKKPPLLFLVASL